jgi:hypothetical protein
MNSNPNANPNLSQILAAFEDIVTRNLIEIRKYGFGDTSDESNKLEWSSTQFWTIVKLLTNKMSVRGFLIALNLDKMLINLQIDQL